MSKGAWIGTIAVLLVIGLGGGGLLYVNHQSQDRELKEEQAKNSSLSKKLDSSDKRKETSEKKSSSQQSSSSMSESSASSSEETNPNEPVNLTVAQKRAVNDSFLSWASDRAKIGNMAVTEVYFDHGAAGRGDWYANTPDGEVQVQDQKNPGAAAFPIHKIGGCVFLTMKDGSTGYQENVAEFFAGGYGVKADMSQPVTKYMLGDNGKVYELTLDKGDTSLTSGFGEYTDEGQRGDYNPPYSFKVSEDQAAQAELQKILANYR